MQNHYIATLNEHKTIIINILKSVALLHRCYTKGLWIIFFKVILLKNLHISLNMIIFAI